MNQIANHIDKLIKQYEDFKSDFNEEHEKKLIFTMILADLSILRNKFFEEWKANTSLKKET